jgi:hypothetical protein
MPPQFSREIDGYDEVMRWFGRTRDLQLRLQVARALVNMARLNPAPHAIPVADEVIRRYGDAPEPELREQFEQVLARKAKILGERD